MYFVIQKKQRSSMSSCLWKVNVIKQGQGAVAVGMNVEIVMNGTTAKPSNELIANAINDKYGIKCSPSTIENWITVTKG